MTLRRCPLPARRCTVFDTRIASFRPALFPLLAGSLLMAALLSSAVRAGAQTTDASVNLPPATRRTVEQLASLNQLPAGEWKFHAGDVSQGEARNPDGSIWHTPSPKCAPPMEA